ncbi:Hypothetical protein CINCED_3A008762 [Cinara cedri]|nr:Hypothetical protein CINCED_3A008762 [Cinara cedri]
MVAASLVYCDQEDNDSDDNCCIYTYRGDRQAPIVNALPVENRSASPLMDYLEMDFDPEPTAGNESEVEDEEVIVPHTTAHQNDEMLMKSEEPVPSGSGANANAQEGHMFTQNSGINEMRRPVSEIKLNHMQCIVLKEETKNGCLRRNVEMDTMKRMRVDELNWVREVIWSESDAAELQINQIGKSACGATSIINTLLALRIPFNIDRIVQTIGTHLRKETAPLIQYLESRAVAGCTADDLVRTLETVTDSLVSARFFATHQNSGTSIEPWLANWIKKGAVPILTLNRQRCPHVPDYLLPDSWHHQMMYGITYNPLYPENAQIHLTNPLSKISMELLRPQLISPSVLKIRKEDILSRWTPCTDLVPLASYPNPLWHEFNVLGQVVNILREKRENATFNSHITIPASYKSGITLAINTSSHYCHELKSVPEL